MKKIYTLFLSLITFGLFAQTAPDFTVTDTHGVEHSLYEDYLNQGKTVVLDLFFVNCGPCNTLAPLLEPVYQEWGAGEGSVQFISLTSEPNDTDPIVIGFEEQHGTTWPAVSADGGGPEAVQAYTDHQFGQFVGYPTLVIIAPDGTVQFDPWVNNNYEGTIELLNEWIENTGASRPISNIVDLDNVSSFSINPNPVASIANLNLVVDKQSQTNVAVFNTLGQQIKTIYSGTLNAGIQKISMNSADLTPGTYFIKVSMDGESKMQQFVKI